RIAALAARVHGAVVVDAQVDDRVRFGATVTVRDAAGGEQRLRIVGVDEANGKAGLVAFVAPIARALLGRCVGEIASVRTPRGEEELEIVGIAYDHERDA